MLRDSELCSSDLKWGKFHFCGFIVAELIKKL